MHSHRAVNMLRWAFQIAKTRRTGKIVVAGLRPLIQRSSQRFHGIPSRAWLDSYMLGFMAMLITALARAEHLSISNADLCALQANAWSELTEMDAGLFGAEVLLLTASQDTQFVSGCCDAENVAASIHVARATQQVDAPDSEAWASVARTWEMTFDRRITSISADVPIGLSG